jgi:hypothetical protein
MINKIIIIIFFGVSLFGCMSQIVSIEEHTKSWIGRPIHEMKDVMARPESYASRINWQDITYELENGNSVFVEPEPRCKIHWEIDQNDIIVGYITKDGNCD